MNVTLTGSRLTVPRISASQPDVTHAPWIDLETGVWECPPSCPARRNPKHKHARELLALRAALNGFAAMRGSARDEAVRALNAILRNHALINDELLGWQLEWCDETSLTYLAAKLTLADRAALAEAARVAERSTAA